MARARQQPLGFLRGVFAGGIVITRATALAIVPMCYGMDGFVFLRPRIESGTQLGGNFIKRYERLVAMLTDKTGLTHVAREQRQERRAAAR